MKFLAVMMFVFTLGSANQSNTTGQKTNPSPQWICSPSMSCQASGAKENMIKLIKKVEDNGKSVQKLLKKARDNGMKIDSLEKKLSPPRNNSVSYQVNVTREMMSELMTQIQENGKKVQDNGKDVQELLKKAQDNGKKIDALEKKHSACIIGKGKDCADLYKKGYKQDGVYTVNPDGLGEFQVYCDQSTISGGWTIFQRRLDGSEDFYRNWTDYKNGFGDVRGEYWLGLDKINRLTRLGSYRLRVDLQDTSSNWRYAEYANFFVLSEQANYKLSIGKYTGTAGDSLSYHNNHPFSTKDRDNDSTSGNCAQEYKGAWWYRTCHFSCLNGLYLYGTHSSLNSGVIWAHWKGHYYSLKRAEMKVRPIHY